MESDSGDDLQVQRVEHRVKKGFDKTAQTQVVSYRSVSTRVMYPEGASVEERQALYETARQACAMQYQQSKLEKEFRNRHNQSVMKSIKQQLLKFKTSKAYKDRCDKIQKNSTDLVKTTLKAQLPKMFAIQERKNQMLGNLLAMSSARGPTIEEVDDAPQVPPLLFLEDVKPINPFVNRPSEQFMNSLRDHLSQFEARDVHQDFMISAPDIQLLMVRIDQAIETQVNLGLNHEGTVEFFEIVAGNLEESVMSALWASYMIDYSEALLSNIRKVFNEATEEEIARVYDGLWTLNYRVWIVSESPVGEIRVTLSSFEEYVLINAYIAYASV